MSNVPLSGGAEGIRLSGWVSSSRAFKYLIEHVMLFIHSHELFANDPAEAFCMGWQTAKAVMHRRYRRNALSYCGIDSMQQVRSVARVNKVRGSAVLSSGFVYFRLFFACGQFDPKYLIMQE